MESPWKPVLAALMLALASNRLGNVLAADEIVWRVHDVTLSASFALAALLALLVTPYRLLMLKCCAALITGVAAVDFVCVLFQAPGYWYWLAVQIALGTVLSCIYYMRSYDVPSDQMEPGYLYCLRTKPRSLQDFLIALIGIYGPNGGYALYANGVLYRYRRGELVGQNVASVPAERYHVSRGAKLSSEVTRELGFLVGSRWSLRHNCLTVLGPVWRRHSG